MSSNVVDYKVTIGRWVSDRLSRNPTVLRIPSNQIDMFVARDFLSAGECDGLIGLIDTHRVPSGLLSPSADPDFRTSESCNMRPDHPLVRKTEARITDLMGIQPAHGETIQGQRYAVGQQFKPHHDFFHDSEPYWPDMQLSGGQRTWTAMVFLNTPEGGGQTAFEQAGLKIAPRRGNLLTWNNLDASGHPNPFTLRQGCPVTAGTKYVITKWYRERPWTYSEVVTY
ncbi:MAG: 2OG-Fe(II) oxygenase [Allosphingosinicella sp.]